MEQPLQSFPWNLDLVSGKGETGGDFRGRLPSKGLARSPRTRSPSLLPPTIDVDQTSRSQDRNLERENKFDLDRVKTLTSLTP